MYDEIYLIVELLKSFHNVVFELKFTQVVFEAKKEAHVKESLVIVIVVSLN